MTMQASLQRQAAARDEKIPRNLLRAMLALVLTVLAMVTYARIVDLPVTATPPGGDVAVERTLFLVTHDLSGAVTVLDDAGALVADLSPERGGFVAGIARVIHRERIKGRAPLDGPVHLVQRSTGRIEITDPTTGWHADLMGFGADNSSAFARLLGN